MCASHTWHKLNVSPSPYRSGSTHCEGHTFAFQVQAQRHKTVVLQTRLDMLLGNNKRRGHKVRYKEMAEQWLSPQLLGVFLKGAEYRGHSHHTGTGCSETFLNLLSLVPAHAGIFCFEPVSHMARIGLELTL